MRVGARINQARVARGYTFREAAEDLDVDASAVLRWEAGLTLPSSRRVATLADWCGVDLETFTAEWRQDVADKRQGISLAPEQSDDLGTALREVRDLRDALQAALDRLQPPN
jgi:transcriptional regulator with XRE-family HTH domain